HGGPRAGPRRAGGGGAPPRRRGGRLRARLARPPRAVARVRVAGARRGARRGRGARGGGVRAAPGRPARRGGDGGDAPAARRRALTSFGSLRVASSASFFASAYFAAP